MIFCFPYYSAGCSPATCPSAWCLAATCLTAVGCVVVCQFQCCCRLEPCWVLDPSLACSSPLLDPFSHATALITMGVLGPLLLLPGPSPPRASCLASCWVPFHHYCDPYHVLDLLLPLLGVSLHAVSPPTITWSLIMHWELMHSLLGGHVHFLVSDKLYVIIRWGLVFPMLNGGGWEGNIIL